MPLNYVEDWLECMAGRRDIQGAPRQNMAWDVNDVPIKLATYDKRFVDSTVGLIALGKGLTDKQTLLAIKIITKYKRQWSWLGMDPSYLQTDEIPLRLPQRAVDHTTSITRQGKTLYLRFPYNQNLINAMYNQRIESHDLWRYEKNKRSWMIDMTESNLRSLLNIECFSSMPWIMDEDLTHLFDTARLCLHEPQMMPIMDFVNGEMIFRDVPEQAMESFLNTRHGDVSMDALIALCHGISLGPGIKGLHTSEHPINSLLDKESWQRSHLSYLSVSDVHRVMYALPDADFTFLINNSHKSSNIKSNLVDAFIDLDNEKTYLEGYDLLPHLGGTILGSDPAFYDAKKNILVSYSLSAFGFDETINVADQFIGVLHMDMDIQWRPAS